MSDLKKLRADYHESYHRVGVPRAAVEYIDALEAAAKAEQAALADREETSAEVASLAAKLLPMNHLQVAEKIIHDDGFLSEDKLKEFWHDCKRVMASALTQARDNGKPPA
jgi:hypothetical protein